MDASQPQQLKAYGVIFRSLKAGWKTEWLLNYRAGSFLLERDARTERDAALVGVSAQFLTDSDVLDIRGQIASGNMEAIPLEKAPKVAVYQSPSAQPWDDAVRIALAYADIEHDKLWDAEVLGGQLKNYEWLHLHHEDFTGQYSKFYLTYSGSPWLADAVQRNTQMAKQWGFANVAELKKQVARRIRTFVENGGFLFAMCTATETLEIALAAEGVDVAAAYADGTPPDAAANAKLRWDRTMAFQNGHLELSPAIASFSDIDGHQVNNTPLRQQLGAFKLFNFSAKIDPVPAMLVQCHRQIIPDFYGLTTSFIQSRLKPGVTVLADEPGAPWVKYIHGDYGKGTWTFLGGHDPEDPQHQVGDPATDLTLHPQSPGYRLILNNVLFPAAKKRELKT
ncbi:MAG: asparagine synthetase B [Gemmatimonadetes bacterium]|nr:asparagine synthetase B [Gemmatimonadota bacterium]